MTATTLPDPLVSAEVDLRDFGFMPLDVLRLRDSDLAALATGDEFKAAVLLWCVAWHQVPAASLPCDDRLLARYSGAGAAWRKVKAEALRGFVECSDGRLYHATIAEKAREAWEAKAAQRARTAAATLAREAKRRAEQAERDAPRNGARDDQRDEQRDVARNVVQGTGTVKGQGQGDSIPPSAGAGAPPAPADVIFGLGIPLLTAANVADRNARSMLGLMRKTHGDTAVIDALNRCASEKPLQPVAWLQAALKTGGAKPRKTDTLMAGNIAAGQRFLEGAEP